MEPIILKSYSSLWKWMYRKEVLILRFALRGHLVNFQHVGSTAIPGMLAKPIIDMLATVTNFEHTFQYIPVIEQLGYDYMGEDKKRRQYNFVKGKPARYHLYVIEETNPIWTDGIAFRDYLIQNRELAYEYADLKRRLADHYADDLRAYHLGKQGFVERVQRATLGVVNIGDKQGE